MTTHDGIRLPRGVQFCPYCSHSMMSHDGDGYSEHFACCDDACNCAWEYGRNEKDYWEVTIVRKP